MWSILHLGGKENLPDTNAHHDTPEDHEASDGDGSRLSRKRLGEGGEDDDDKLKTVL